jgi:hypothetical protein
MRKEGETEGRRTRNWERGRKWEDEKVRPVFERKG